MKKDKKEKVNPAEQAAATPPRKEGKKTFSFLRRNAVEVMRFRVLRKIIFISITVISALMLVLYSFALVYDKTGRFTVNVKSPDAAYYNITLSELPDFPVQTSVLHNNQQVKMTNICGNDLPLNLDMENGAHNGENYLAYTFYCKNLRSTPCSLHYELSYNNVTNGMDECIRVRVYVNGEKTDYAKTRSDGTGAETHFCDESFANASTVCYKMIDRIEGEEVVKFTVVVWLEGDDDDTLDNVINGSIKFAMDIKAQEPIITD